MTLAQRIVKVKNLKKDFKDPDLKSYGKKMPLVNKAVMKTSIKLHNTGNTVKKVLKNTIAPAGKKVIYKAAVTKQPKQVLIGVKKTPKKPTMKQYGDKGYKPSTGRGVGM